MLLHFNPILVLFRLVVDFEDKDVAVKFQSYISLIQISLDQFRELEPETISILY